MRRISIAYMIMTVVLSLASCSEDLDMKGLFLPVCEGSNTRFAQSMEYNEGHGYETIIVDDDEYRLYVMTDAHVDYSTDNLDRYVEDCLSDPDAAPFTLCLGDMVNAIGHQDLFREHVGPLMERGSFFTVAGNHDVYFDQWKTYRSHWHSSTYWFEVRTPGAFRDLYIALDSANGKLGTDQRRWLEDLLEEKSEQGYRHVVVFTHTHFFKKDESQGHTSNFNMEEVYDLASLFSRYGVDLVLQGHSHHRDASWFKGVLYLRLDALEDHYPNAFYTIMSMGDDIEYEYIPVGPQDPDRNN